MDGYDRADDGGTISSGSSEPQTFDLAADIGNMVSIHVVDQMIVKRPTTQTIIIRHPQRICAAVQMDII